MADEKQVNFLAGPATQAQLKFLKGRFGGQASALRIAIDRMYQEEIRVTARRAIANKVTEMYDDGSPNVYKGHDYDGAIQAYGWWYRPFNSRPVYLGTSEAAALAMLDQIAESWQEE